MVYDSCVSDILGAGDSMLWFGNCCCDCVGFMDWECCRLWDVGSPVNAGSSSGRGANGEFRMLGREVWVCLEPLLWVTTSGLG